jgi:hypothetical protein
LALLKDCLGVVERFSWQFLIVSFGTLEAKPRFCLECYSCVHVFIVLINEESTRQSRKGTIYTFLGPVHLIGISAELSERCSLFDRQPYRPPDTHPTIFLIEHSRDLYARQIYEATIIRSNAAKDNPKSHAMRRWVKEPFHLTR